jgi:hypothetical protein
VISGEHYARLKQSQRQSSSGSFLHEQASQIHHQTSSTRFAPNKLKSSTGAASKPLPQLPANHQTETLLMKCALIGRNWAALIKLPINVDPSEHCWCDRLASCRQGRPLIVDANQLILFSIDLATCGASDAGPPFSSSIVLVSVLATHDIKQIMAPTAGRTPVQFSL